MKQISSIQIRSTEGLPEIEGIDAQLKALILTPEGAIPGSRGFGLTRDFLDRPFNEAPNLLGIELEEKVEEYIPEITIANVQGETDINGLLGVTIDVERRDGAS